mgnify:CR=1 FL=1
MRFETIQGLEAIVYAIQNTTKSGWIDWVSVVISLIGVVLSFVAIIVAARVPIKIAKQQDKIGLFEKRYECYTVIQKILVISEQIKPCTTKMAVVSAFKLWFGDKKDFAKNESYTEYVIVLKSEEVKLVAGQFLFPEYNAEMLSEIINEATTLIEACSVHSTTEKEGPYSREAGISKDRFCALCDQFKEKYVKQIESELQLTSKKQGR